MVWLVWWSTVGWILRLVPPQVWDIAHRRCQKSLDAHAHFATSLDFHRFIWFFEQITKLSKPAEIVLLNQAYLLNTGHSPMLSLGRSTRLWRWAISFLFLSKIWTTLFSGVGMSLGLGLLDSDINRGWRDTVFFQEKLGRKWNHCPEMGTFWNCSWGWPSQWPRW